MPTTPNINKILAKESVSSGYGAPMGARNIVEKSSLPLLLQRVDLVDGDYSKDGTYWGSGGEPLWCAFNQEDDNHAPAMGTRVYVRAPNWNVAAQRARDIVGKDVEIERQRPNEEDADFLRKVIDSYDKGEAKKDMLDFAASVAARAGLESELEDLLRCGVDPNAQNGAGDTLLIIAAKAGSKECAQVLLRFGADPHAKNGAGKDASGVAREVGDLEIAQVIEDFVRRSEKLSSGLYGHEGEDEGDFDDDVQRDSQ